MLRSKNILTAVLLGAALGACKNDDAQQQAALPNKDSLQKTLADSLRRTAPMFPERGQTGMHFTINHTPRQVDSLVRLKEIPRKPEAAAEYFLSMPPKLLVPPHLTPAKDLSLRYASADTMVYSFTSALTKMNATIELKRYLLGGDSLWLPISVQELAEPRQ